MHRFSFLAIALVFALSGFLYAGEEDAYFHKAIQPILGKYCLGCHSTEKQKGDLDLQRFTNLNQIRKHPKVWQLVAEQLALNEMPPAKEKTQPTASEKELLVKWVQSTLDAIALSNSGDPGPVVLRRLSNAEYTYTIRDLTGVATLDPAREFPVDGAAGEGFTNTGQSLVMSPSLITKYLDAGKLIANHAILLPDGIRFSAKTTRRDQTEELLAEIRKFYRDFTEARANSKVVLQGIAVEYDGGGRLPLDKYIAATLGDREALASEAKTIEVIAQERGLSAKYLGTLYQALNSKEPSLPFDPIRARWLAAKPSDAAALAAEIGEWQKALWKFSNVGHIGKVDGPKAWMEPLNPLASKQDVKIKWPPTQAKEVTLYLIATDAGDGNANDFVEWKNARLIAPGKPDVMLRDVRDICRAQDALRERVVSTTSKALAAAAEAGAGTGAIDVAELARKHGVEADVLTAWIRYLGMNAGGPAKIEGHFKGELKSVSGHDFINGWGSSETPLVLANSSDKHVRVPGDMKPRGVVLHPSVKLQAAAGWRSPVDATVSIEATISRAHIACGNGVNWSLQLRRGTNRQKLASGSATDGQEKKTGPIKNIAVRTGDVISLLIDPREGNHSCDLTAVELVITSEGAKPTKWVLSEDVSPEVLAGNPHADKLGNKDVWHFYSEAVGEPAQSGPSVPAGSMLARWQSASAPAEKATLAGEVQKLLATGAPEGKDNPDALLFRQLLTLGGPLMSAVRSSPTAEKKLVSPVAGDAATTWGIDPALFGKHPNGGVRDKNSLCVRAPAVLEIRLPAELAAGYEFVATGMLDAETGAEGSVQLQALTSNPKIDSVLPAIAIVTNDNSQTRKRIEAALEEFRNLFPAALCYSKIVPTDEVVTLTLIHREDHHLSRLILNDTQKAKLDRLWGELRFISQDALTLVDVYDQIWQFLTQDGDPKSIEPLREPIKQSAEAFKKLLVDTQPKHVEALVKFADRAFRRSLSDSEKSDLNAFYRKLRDQELSHDEAVRLTLARIFISPSFLYRAEKPVAGKEAGPVNDIELANRLSYFLWSSMPDTELSELAAAGKLRDSKVLSAQTQRMLRDPRVSHMAVEFGCAWLHIHGFDELSEKSDRHFPTFVALRGAMYEETIRFFTDFFQNDRTVLNILNADYTYLNEPLAKHYEIPGIKGMEWRRVEGMRKYSRGGILGQATTLAKQSGASRTSPILRGNWVAEVLLGDKLPKPPKDVPQLPEDESNEKLTMRQLTEKHTSDARCASCHARIDPFGYSLEAFDAIGRKRTKDLGDRPIDTRTKTMDGVEFEGLDGLRDYLLTKKQDAFVRQFCRKLLGYSLGRSVQLSDEALLKEIHAQLKANDFRVSVAIEKIVQSSQFRNIRGLNAANDE